MLYTYMLYRYDVVYIVYAIREVKETCVTLEDFGGRKDVLFE